MEALSTKVQETDAAAHQQEAAAVALHEECQQLRSVVCGWVVCGWVVWWCVASAACGDKMVK